MGTPRRGARLRADFRRGSGRLERAAARLGAGRDRATRAVDDLLDTWSGTVATSYAEGFETWRTGAAQVLGALETMGRLLRAVDADLGATDAGAGLELDQLAARLG